MPKKNNKLNYWIEREKNNLTVELMKDEEVSREMKRIIEHAMETCRKEIEAFYTRYANKEGITVADAKKAVDEFDVIAHQNMAKQYVKNKEFSDKANERLRLYNVTMRINREELLLSALNTHLIAATNDIEHTMNDYLEDGAIREFKRQAGILGNISIKESDIHAIVNASYYDATWSERLWDNMDDVRKVVDASVKDTILRGRHPQESVKRLRELTGRSEYEARRLLISEVSRVQTEAKRLSYEEMDILEYKYLAIIDNRTTQTCKSLHGKTFKVSDMKVGVNAPPMHQFCRSTTVPTKRKEEMDWEDEEDGDLFIDDEQIEREADAENDAVLSDIDDIMKRIDNLDDNQIERVDNKLQQAKKLGKKINITDQAIEKVRKIDIPTHSKEENATIQMLHQQLLKDSKENNDSNEVVYFLVDDDLRIAYGNQTEVRITGDDSILLDNAKINSVIMLHNHPGGSSFSLTDLKTLFTTNSIKTLTIVTNQGNVKFITKTDDFDIVEALKVTSEVLKDVPIEDINSSIIEMLLKRLYTLGMIIFKVR
ncbi:minor capsid protein [Macrococcoides canis]|uniref:minor capsid protein n=1 Tax=Macrococcoides canis TaxID=1855823 RepID=UPI00207D5518|nr:minor capsid protein [Macrococcus canis]MCO4095717.1 minor capsid protein [Macrococcus canis]UTH08426.1 minor capsid protein [Macrococcus canis]